MQVARVQRGPFPSCAQHEGHQASTTLEAAHRRTCGRVEEEAQGCCNVLGLCACKGGVGRCGSLRWAAQGRHKGHPDGRCVLPPAYLLPPPSACHSSADSLRAVCPPAKCLTGCIMVEVSAGREPSCVRPSVCFVLTRPGATALILTPCWAEVAA